MDERNTLPARIDAIRRFNRCYTRTIGVLHEGLLQSRFSLAEARVLFELAQRDTATATVLSRELDLDIGYLSRILQRFERDGLIQRSRSEADGRQSMLALTQAGHAAFTPLEQRSRQEIGTLIGRLPESGQAALVAAMGRIETLLEPKPGPWLLRQHNPGDIGWVIARHGALYAQEYGFDSRFEALVARVAGDFLADHNPARERCWIAERDGNNLGSVFVVQKTPEMAKLRLLLVEPAARGLGIGRRLTEEAIRFARNAGYQRMTLWTNDILLAARTIYQQAGFRLVTASPHSDFGPAMVGEDWELTLRP